MTIICKSRNPKQTNKQRNKDEEGSCPSVFWAQVWKKSPRMNGIPVCSEDPAQADPRNQHQQRLTPPGLPEMLQRSHSCLSVFPELPTFASVLLESLGKEGESLSRWVSSSSKINGFIYLRNIFKEKRNHKSAILTKTENSSLVLWCCVPEATAANE